MEKFITEIKNRFASLETLEGVSLLTVGVCLLLGQAIGLLPFFSIGLVALGAYKMFVNRKS